MPSRRYSKPIDATLLRERLNHHLEHSDSIQVAELEESLNTIHTQLRCWMFVLVILYFGILKPWLGSFV